MRRDKADERVAGDKASNIIADNELQETRLAILLALSPTTRLSAVVVALRVR